MPFASHANAAAAKAAIKALPAYTAAAAALSAANITANNNTARAFAGRSVQYCGARGK